MTNLTETKYFGNKKYTLFGMGYKETSLAKSIKAYGVKEKYYIHIVHLNKNRKDKYVWAMYVREKR